MIVQGYWQTLLLLFRVCVVFFYFYVFMFGFCFGTHIYIFISRIWFLHDGYRLTIMGISNYVEILLIKQLICNKTRTPVWNQNIIFNGCILNDNDILAYCNVNNNSYLYLVCKNLNVPKCISYEATNNNTHNDTGNDNNNNNNLSMSVPRVSGFIDNSFDHPYIIPMTLNDLSKLKLNQFIYHRCKLKKYQFCDAIIKEINENLIKIHYIGQSTKYDIICDMKEDRHQFGKHLIVNNQFKPVNQQIINTINNNNASNSNDGSNNNSNDLICKREAFDELNDLYYRCMNHDSFDYISNYYKKYPINLPNNILELK